jgi:hypothetical protein
MDERVDIILPVALEDCQAKLLAESTLDTFDDCVCRRVLDRCWLALDAVACEQLLEFD